MAVILPKRSLGRQNVDVSNLIDTPLDAIALPQGDLTITGTMTLPKRESVSKAKFELPDPIKQAIDEAVKSLPLVQDTMAIMGRAPKGYEESVGVRERATELMPPLTPFGIANLIKDVGVTAIKKDAPIIDAVLGKKQRQISELLPESIQNKKVPLSTVTSPAIAIGGGGGKIEVKEALKPTEELANVAAGSALSRVGAFGKALAARKAMIDSIRAPKSRMLPEPPTVELQNVGGVYQQTPMSKFGQALKTSLEKKMQSRFGAARVSGKSEVPQFRNSEEAIVYGESVKGNEEAINELKRLRDESLLKFGKMKETAKTIQDKNELMKVSTTGQLYREALQSAGVPSEQISQTVEDARKKTTGIEIENKAIKDWFETKNPEEALFITSDGRYIDGTGKNQVGEKERKYMTERVVDHREVASQYSEKQGTEALIDYMNKTGNVRMVIVGNDLHLDIAVYPTEKQLNAIRKASIGREIVADISDKNGNNVSSGIFKTFNEYKKFIDKNRDKIGSFNQPLAGGMMHEAPQYVKDKLEQGVTITDVKPMSFRIVEPVTVKDVHGNKVELPKGHEFTEAHLSNGKIWLHDGKNLVVNKDVLAQLPKKSYIQLGESKFMTPEEQGVEVVRKGRNRLPYLVEDANGEEIGRYATKQEAQKIAETEGYGIVYLGDELKTTKSDTKFSQYQEPGGENYREVLVKAPIPPKQSVKEFYKPGRIVKGYGGYYDKVISFNPGTGNNDWSVTVEGVDKNGNPLPPHRGGGTRTHSTYPEELQNRTDVFKSSHWEEPNVIAHYRANDRVTPDGKKVMFIEEIQSDWNKKFREEGAGLSSEEINELNSLLEKKDKDRTVMESARIADLEIKKDRAVQSHPLLKNWQELALKNALKDAVEGGADYLSWVTGEQTANRYDLSKVVNSINWWSDEKTSYVELKGVKGVSNQDIEVYVDKKTGEIKNADLGTPKDWIGKNLSDVIGKDHSEKILSKEKGTIENENLKITAPWAKNLYDKQIPSILKKLTGQDIEVIKLSTGEQQAIRITPKIRAIVQGEQPMAGGTPTKPPKIETTFEQPEPHRKPEGAFRKRGFVSSVENAMPELKVHGQYIPRDTDELSIKAKNLIKDDIVTAERMANEGTNDASVAVAAELLKKYYSEANASTDKTIKDALYDKAEKLTVVVSEKLTELGRAVQAAHILSLQTPEGQLRFANNLINKYNEKIAESKGGLLGLRKKIPNLTPEQADHIQNEMKAIQGMQDGHDKAYRFRTLQNYIKDFIPSSLYDKIITLWKAGLLTGLKTTGVNTLANLSHYALEAIKDVPASGVDSVASWFTKERTIYPVLRGTISGFREGFEKGWRYLKTGFDERNAGLKLDYNRVNFGKGKIAKALQKYEETVFGLLGAEDQPFYYGAKARSIYSQAIALAKNKGLKGRELQTYIDALAENPTDDMVRNAVLDAETSVFQNQTILSKIAKKIQEAPGGQIVVPFGRTPSAVAMQIINYSPVGIVKSIIDNAGQGRFDQRKFSQAMGRGLTGIVPLVIGGALFANKLMNLERPNNEKEQKLWELEGRMPNTIKIGNKWRSIQVLGPAGNLLLIGGHFRRAFDKDGSPSAAMIEALTGSAKSFTEQTFLQGVNSIASAINDPQRSAEGYLKSIVSSIVPTIVGDVAKATDTQERRAETPLQSMQAKIPFLRNMLEPKVNVMGHEKSRGGNILEIMIDPTRPSKEKSTPVVKELRRLWDAGYKVSPTQLGKKDGYKSLTPEENTQLWVNTGRLIETRIKQLISRKGYDIIPDDQKEKMIDKIVNDSQDQSRYEIVRSKLSGLYGNDRTQKLKEYRDDNLLTESLARRFGYSQRATIPFNPPRIIRKRVIQ